MLPVCRIWLFAFYDVKFGFCFYRSRLCRRGRFKNAQILFVWRYRQYGISNGVERRGWVLPSLDDGHLSAVCYTQYTLLITYCDSTTVLWSNAFAGDYFQLHIHASLVLWWVFTEGLNMGFSPFWLSECGLMVTQLYWEGDYDWLLHECKYLLVGKHYFCASTPMIAGPPSVPTCILSVDRHECILQLEWRIEGYNQEGVILLRKTYCVPLFNPF